MDIQGVSFSVCSYFNHYYLETQNNVEDIKDRVSN
jgi:hypothetical protein